MGNAASKKKLSKKLAKSSTDNATPLASPESAKHYDCAKLVEEKWCNALNRQDMKTIVKFSAPGSQCWFNGAEKGMSLDDFLGAVMMLVQSFPDNTMRWESIEEIQPGVVFVKNFVGRGTHTGKPFAFGPYPPIPATGIIVEEDPCHLTITISKGKMTKFVIDAYSGDLVGPPGYYEKIGGKLR